MGCISHSTSSVKKHNSFKKSHKILFLGYFTWVGIVWSAVCKPSSTIWQGLSPSTILKSAQRSFPHLRKCSSHSQHKVEVMTDTPTVADRWILQMPCLEMPSLAAQKEGCSRDQLDFGFCIFILNSAHAVCPLYKVEVTRDLWGQAKFGKRDLR